MQAKAVTKYVRISPTKVRPVMDLVRGKPVDRALAILRYLPHKAAREIARTIESARANATNYYDMAPAAPMKVRHSNGSCRARAVEPIVFVSGRPISR